MRNTLLIPARVALLALSALFLLSRIAFSYAGVRFNTFPLYTSWQFLDPELLRGDLLRSVFYLHSQPPLFNLFLGTMLKLFPEHTTTSFHAVYAFLGLTLALMLFSLMRKLGVDTPLAFALTVLFLVSPGFVLCENWLFYTLPLALMLCLTSFFMIRFLQNNRLLDGVALFSLLASAVLTRSLFHLLWFIVVAAGVLYFKRRTWKSVMIAAVVPLGVLLMWHGKNIIVFGTPSSSTWLGMSLAKMTVEGLPVDQRQRMVKEGELSPLSLVHPFGSLEKYRGLTTGVSRTGIAALDQEQKSSANTNFNNIAYLGISQLYLQDALAVIRSHPEIYATAILHAYFIFFRPAQDYALFEHNRTALGKYDAAFSTVVLGQVFRETPILETEIYFPSVARQVFRMGLIVLLVFFVAVWHGASRVRNDLRSHAPLTANTATILFMLFTILYVTLAGNALEIGENNRFRFMIDPFLLALFGLFLQTRLTKATANQVS